MSAKCCNCVQNAFSVRSTVSILVRISVSCLIMRHSARPVPADSLHYHSMMMKCISHIQCRFHNNREPPEDSAVSKTLESEDTETPLRESVYASLGVSVCAVLSPVYGINGTKLGTFLLRVIL